MFCFSSLAIEAVAVLWCASRGRVGILLYPFAKLADAVSSCWSRLRTSSAQKDLERVQQEMEKDEFDQTMCPICLEHLGCMEKFKPPCSSTLLLQ
jgi:hypothetical protein